MYFGCSLSMSADGTRLAVGAQGVASGAGRVYVFHRVGTAWAPEAEVNATNAKPQQSFGYSVALSADGQSLAVGAGGEQSITGDPNDTSGSFAGAVYTFTYAASWSGGVRIKAPNNRNGLRFGWSVAMSGDGSRLYVGGIGDSSSATTVNGASTDDGLTFAGAVYALTRSGVTWTPQAYIKPKNARANGKFGERLAVTPDGDTLVIGSSGESSSATGVGGNAADTTASNSGAVYVYRFGSGTWAEDAYVKASNTRASAYFGGSLAVSVDGTNLLVGSTGDSSLGHGVNGTQGDDGAVSSGAAYLFAKRAAGWMQTAYIKPEHPAAAGGTNFGSSVAVNDDATLAIGSSSDRSNAANVGGDQTNVAMPGAGAVFTYK
jgi:hypothetical protein